MNKITLLSWFLIIGLLSCKTSEKKIDKLQIAKQYYQALNNSDGVVMSDLLTDSLLTVETDYDYKQTFSKEEYIEDWLKWDSIFAPTYKIIKIEQENETVKAEISKLDKRIKLLHEGPTVWKAIIRFDGNKIVRIDRSNVVFNDTLWVKNRTALINWIDQNHPELSGFLNGQNKSVGTKYLKAIELYNNRE